MIFCIIIEDQNYPILDSVFSPLTEGVCSIHAFHIGISIGEFILYFTPNRLKYTASVVKTQHIERSISCCTF